MQFYTETEYLDQLPNNVRKVIEAVTLVTGVNYRLMISKSRLREYVHARHLAMYFIRKHTPYSFAEIGKYLGNRDHSTVMHGIEKLNDLMYDRDCKNTFENVEKAVNEFLKLKDRKEFKKKLNEVLVIRKHNHLSPIELTKFLMS